MVQIEIDDPVRAIQILDVLYPRDWGTREVSNKDAYRWMHDVQKKIERAVLEEKYRDEWRVIPDFSWYEISGGGLIRNKESREQIGISVIQDEPTIVYLRDDTGWVHDLRLVNLIHRVFPELSRVPDPPDKVWVIRDETGNVVGETGVYTEE